MTRLSYWVLCSTWFECTLVSQSPAVFWANGFCFRKGSVQGSADDSLHLSLKGTLLHSSSLGGSASPALHLSPSLLLGPKLRELLTCLTHANPVRRNHPSCCCCWGILWAYFTKSAGRYLKKYLRDYPQKNVWRYFSLLKSFTIFWGNIGVYVQETLWKA